MLQPAEIDALERVNAKQAEHRRELEHHLEQEVQRLEYAAQPRRAAIRQRGPREPPDRRDAGDEVGGGPGGAGAGQGPAGRTEGPRARNRSRSRRSCARPSPTSGRRLPELWERLPVEARKTLLRTLVAGVNLESRRDRRGADPDRVARRPGQRALGRRADRHRSATRSGSAASSARIRRAGRRGSGRRRDRRGPQPRRLPPVPRRGLHRRDRRRSSAVAIRS